MTQWRNGEPKIWHWRIRAMSSTGQMVTLGKYDTEDEARVDHARIIKDACYRDASIEQITAAHQTPDPDIRP
jgi:hypothetical protein